MTYAAKERPILFSAPMVRALLDGSKTQTRRIVKGQTPEWAKVHDEEYSDGRECFMVLGERDGRGMRPILDVKTCRYGQEGDSLWVRETFSDIYGAGGDEQRRKEEVMYRANGETDPYVIGYRWTPSIHMPRWASRILLEVVSVRVERLNDCSEADAKAEGVMQLDADDWRRPEVRAKEGWSLCPTCAGTGLHNTLGPNGGVNCDVDCPDCDTHRKLYQHLWESINGAGSWAANPWVWCIEFRRIAP